MKRIVLALVVGSLISGFGNRTIQGASIRNEREPKRNVLSKNTTIIPQVQQVQQNTDESNVKNHQGVVPVEPQLFTYQIETTALGGESIGWMVFSMAGGTVSDGSNSIGFTMGQTSDGTVSSFTNTLHQGYWQNFSPGSCCAERRGNVDNDGVYPNEIDISDLSVLVNYLMGGGYVFACATEADIDVSGGENPIDISDLSVLVNYLTGGGYIIPNCL